MRSKTLLALVGALGASFLLAGAASAATMMHHDDFSDFNGTWINNSNATGMQIQQMSDSVMLTSGSQNYWYAAMQRVFLPTVMESLEIDFVSYGGTFAFLASKFDANNNYLGSYNMGLNPNNTMDVSGINWGSTAYVRLQVGLQPNSQIEFKDLKAWGASGIPEPNAALLMSLGVIVTSAGIRNQRKS